MAHRAISLRSLPKRVRCHGRGCGTRRLDVRLALLASESDIEGRTVEIDVGLTLICCRKKLMAHRPGPIFGAL